MLTARATGQSARFCGQRPGPKGQARQEPEHQVRPFPPHPHHPPPQGVADRLLCNSVLLELILPEAALFVKRREAPGAAGHGGSPPPASPLLGPSYQIVDAHPEVVRQLPRVFQVRKACASFIHLIVRFRNAQSLRNLHLCFTPFLPKSSDPLFQFELHTASS